MAAYDEEGSGETVGGELIDLRSTPHGQRFAH